MTWSCDNKEQHYPKYNYEIHRCKLYLFFGTKDQNWRWSVSYKNTTIMMLVQVLYFFLMTSSDDKLLYKGSSASLVLLIHMSKHQSNLCVADISEGFFPLLFSIYHINEMVTEKKKYAIRPLLFSLSFICHSQQFDSPDKQKISEKKCHCFHIKILAWCNQMMRAFSKKKKRINITWK